MEHKNHFLLACALIWLTTLSDASAQLKFKDWQVVPAGRRKIAASSDPGSGATASTKDLKKDLRFVPGQRSAVQPPLKTDAGTASTTKNSQEVAESARPSVVPSGEPVARASASKSRKKDPKFVAAPRRAVQPPPNTVTSTAKDARFLRAAHPKTVPTGLQSSGTIVPSKNITLVTPPRRAVQPPQNAVSIAAPTGTDAEVAQVNHRKILQAAHRGSAAESMSGVDSSLPVMPLLPRRQFETPDEPMRTERDPDEPPVSNFVETLEGTEASIELVVSQGRLFRTKQPIVTTEGVSVVAIGDPTVVDFDLLPDSKTLRLRGLRVGVTDMTFVTIDGTSYSFEIHVLYDLPLVQSHLRQVFPTAHIQLKQLREHVIVEGEARSLQQVTQIIDVITAYLSSLQVTQSQQGSRVPSGAIPARGGRRGNGEEDEEPLAPEDPEAGEALPGEEGEGEDDADADDRAAQGIPTEVGGRSRSRARSQAPQIINLLKVPNNQQVMLKVQIAELDRRAIREIGVDLFIGEHLGFPAIGSAVGNFFQSVAAGTGNLVGSFPESNWEIVLNALRENSIATVLAEPNLVTLSGHTATFQSGGEFGFDVAQGFGAVATQFKPFGIILAFTPYVLDDGRIRLQVAPEVSTIDFALTESTNVPGLRTRNASTTVNLREGQTLAIAGLLEIDRTGTTSRVPLVGDIPVVGNLFSDNRYDVTERELVVIVTPHLVDGIDNADCMPLPGEEVLEPNDLEFYLINRIEGRTCRPHRSTTSWDQPLQCLFQMRVEQSYTAGPVGLSN